MNPSKCRIGSIPVRLVLVVLSMVFLNHCAWLVAPPADDQAARQLMNSLAARNAGLEQVKGLLNLRLEAKGRVLTGRAGWAAAVPDRLRIEWLNMMGQPVASLAGDGQTLTIHNYHENTIHHLRQSRSVLDQLIHLPIGIEDLVAVLVGRPLMPAYVAAQEKPLNEDERTIVLKNRWHMPLTRFWFNGAGELLRQEVYEPDGALRYRLKWLAWNKSGAYTVPKKVLVETDSGDTLTLSMERFLPNAQFQPETFVIKGQGDG